MAPIQFAMAEALSFPTGLKYLYTLYNFVNMVLSFNWPLLVTAKFFPNFAMEYIANSFKAWADDINDLHGDHSGSSQPPIDMEKKVAL